MVQANGGGRARVWIFDLLEMGIRLTHPAATYCGFCLSSAPAIVVW
jgi:hypothetical protein